MADLTITVTVNETDQKCLKNDLLDIDEWVQLAVRGKINNCWKRFNRTWTDKLMNDETFTDPIPSNKADFCELVMARDDYKDRAARDAELEPVVEQNGTKRFKTVIHGITLSISRFKKGQGLEAI